MSSPSRSIGHLPGLDGLRGLAVIGVLLFHANWISGGTRWVRGGYLGVDLFFVLSGFLITSILLHEHAQTGTISLRTFWIRRARRLMPALLSLMPAIALYAKTVAAPQELAALRVDALATLGYIANWRAIFARRSYWEMFASPSPLEHTWSLAIEEQFYVVWPLLVSVVVGIGGRRRLLAVCVALLLASCLAMTLLFEEGHTMRAYLGTDTRGAAILVGAILATTTTTTTKPSPATARLLDFLGVAALALLAVAWMWLDGESVLLYRGGFWVTEIAAAVLILCCMHVPNGIVARLLSVRPLRAMGVISYGVYLWHWPIYVVLTEERMRMDGLRLFALRIGMTLVIAGLSYRFLERPIRERGLPRQWGRPLIVVASAVALALVVVIASTHVVVASSQAAPTRRPTFASASNIPSNKPPIPLGSIPPASELPPNTLRVLVVGDSVAGSLGTRMHWVALSTPTNETANAFVEQRAIGDCSILEGVVPTFSMSGFNFTVDGNGNCARAWVADVTELRPDVTVILLGGAYFSTVSVDGHRRSTCHPGWRAPFVKELSRLLVAMAPFAGRRVVLNAPYPVGKFKSPAAYDNVDCYNRMLRDAVDASSGAELIDLNAHVCPGKDRTCTLMSGDAPIRFDGLHFDSVGGEETARWVIEQLRTRPLEQTRIHR